MWRNIERGIEEDVTDKIIEAVKEEYRTFAIVGVTNDGKFSDCYAPTSVPHNMQERMKSAIRTADKKLHV